MSQNRGGEDKEIQQHLLHNAATPKANLYSELSTVLEEGTRDTMSSISSVQQDKQSLIAERKMGQDNIDKLSLYAKAAKIGGIVATASGASGVVTGALDVAGILGVGGVFGPVAIGLGGACCLGGIYVIYKGRELSKELDRQSRDFSIKYAQFDQKCMELDRKAEGLHNDLARVSKILADLKEQKDYQYNLDRKASMAAHVTAQVLETISRSPVRADIATHVSQHSVVALSNAGAGVDIPQRSQNSTNHEDNETAHMSHGSTPIQLSNIVAKC